MQAFFRLRWIICFPLHAPTFCFWVGWKTLRLITDNESVKHIYIIKTKISWNEADVPAHQSLIFKEILLIPKSHVRVCHTVSLFLFISSAISRTLNLHPKHTIVRTVHIHLSSLCRWFPASYVIENIFKPFLELLMPPKNIWFPHSIFAISYFNMVHVSLALLPIFTQNLMLFPCSRFHSLIFRQQYT